MNKLIIAVAVAALSVGCSAGTEEVQHRATVVYEVGGDIDFASYDDNFVAGVQYAKGVTRVELTGEDVPQPPKALYTWANTTGGRTGEAWCRITVDGKVIVEQHTTGEANDPMCFG